MSILSGFRKWIETDSHKEIYKLIFLAPISVLATIILWVLKSLIKSPLPTDLSGWLDFIFSIPASAFKGISESPIWFGIAVSLTLLVSALFVVAYYFTKKIAYQENILNSAATYKALVEQIGIQSRWPNAIIGSSDAPWDQLRADIARNDNRNLLILGANGIDTFGSPNSPLHQSIRDFKGNLRVILSDPKSPQTTARAKAVGTNLSVYRKSIRTSIDFVQKLRTQSRPSLARYYDGKPNWKLLITDHRVWVQYYMPGGPDVAQTPTYIFERTNSPYSLYVLFCAEFERIWERCKDKIAVE